MMPRPRHALACLLVVGLIAPAGAAGQEAPAPKKWSVEEIHGPAKKVAFTVDEGTWMAVEVSPDGRTVIFDLLGDLNSVPIGGGQATRFTSGTRWDATPRYSPDGKRVVVQPFENFYITARKPHDDAKLRRFVPHLRLDAEIRDHNRMFQPHEVPTWFAQSLPAIVRAGGKVGMGSHGQVQGLGSHWEIWAMASAGLTPLEAIPAATITAAEAMGMEDDIGSLEVGKLADLIVLDRNPLVDLTNTTAIRYVMKAGTLWNGETMDEVWPTKRTRPASWWEQQ